MKKKIFTSTLTAIVALCSLSAVNAQELLTLKMLEKNVDLPTAVLEKQTQFEAIQLAPSNFQTKSLKESTEDYAVPYLAEFEDTDKETLEEYGFTLIKTSSTADQNFALGALRSGSSPIPVPQGGSVYIICFPSKSATNEWAITPGLELTENVEYIYEMYAYVPGGSSTQKDEFKVLVGTEATQAGLTDVVMDYTGDNAMQSNEMVFTKLRASFTPSTTDTYFFGINFCTTPNSYNPVAFDNIRIYAKMDQEVAAEFTRIVYPEYTLAPAALAAASSDSILSNVFNYGKNTVTNVITNYSIYKNGATTPAQTLASKPLPTLVAAASDSQASEGKLTLDKPTSKTMADTYKISLTVETEENAEQFYTESIEVKGGLLSDNIYARDNGVAQTYYTSTAAGGYGNKFRVPVETTFSDVVFTLLNFQTSGAAVTRINVYEQLDETDTYTRIYTSAQEDYIELTNSTAAKTYTGTLRNLVFSPGSTYFVSVEQVEGVSLHLVSTSTPTGKDKVGLMMVTIDGQTGVINARAPFQLRLKVAGDETNLVDSSADLFDVFSTQNGFVVEGAQGNDMVVYSISGQQVLSAKIVENNQTISHNLNAGIYLVKIGNSSHKVVVK